MLINLSFQINEEQQELLSVICSLIKTSFKCKLDVQVNREQILGNGGVLPELDFIDMTSDLPRGFYVERDGRQVNLTRSDFLRYCEVLLSKKMELSEPKEQLEYLRSVGVSFPSIQKAFDLTDSEFMSLRSDLVFPYVKAKWQQKFSHLRVKTVDDREAVEAMKKTFGVNEKAPPINASAETLSKVKTVKQLLDVMKESKLSMNKICRMSGVTMAELSEFLAGRFRIKNKEITEKINKHLGTSLEFKDKMPAFLDLLKSKVNSFNGDDIKKFCSDHGIQFSDVCIALGISRPTTRGRMSNSYRSTMIAALTGERNLTIDPADFAECKTTEDFTEVCASGNYESAVLAKATGLSQVTISAIIRHRRKVSHPQALKKIAKFIGHELSARNDRHCLYNNGQLKLSDEKAQLIESLRLQLKSGKLDQLSDYDASHFIVNYFKDNSISYNLLSSLLGISNKNFKTLSANSRKKIVDWVKS